jgi:divalent metal cation (Fe/Co/Zn/Cd) transporter
MKSEGQAGAADCCGSCAHDPGSTTNPDSLPATVAWLQWITIAWMTVECGVSLWAAAQAHSAALLAFGSDSLVELLSAVVVLLQFLPSFPLKKAHADKAAATLLFALAGVVLGVAWLGRSREIETSRLGIAITILALIFMPVLAWTKRREARRINNRALAADATQSATCAYLAGMTLAGLVIFAVWHIHWVDTVAALAAIPILLIEGRRTWQGQGCGCC